MGAEATSLVKAGRDEPSKCGRGSWRGILACRQLTMGLCNSSILPPYPQRLKELTVMVELSC